MKTFTIIPMLILSLCFSHVAAQNIYTVNNQPSFNADFTSLQAAHDSAEAGDILMVHGSSTSYGSLIIKKRIVLIGPGYFLGQNDAPFTQASPLAAEIINLTFQSNSTGTIDASGSLVTGMKVTGTLGGSVASQTPISFTVQRCLINWVDINNYISAIFKENYINYPLNNGFPSVQIDGINNCQFYNNMIVRSGGGNIIVTTNTQNSGVFDHNLFVGLDDDAAYTLEGDGMTFTNNLFLGDLDIAVTGTVGQIQNNMSNGNTFEGVPSNITDIDAATIVIGWANPAGFAPDERFLLTENSPVLDAGSDGDHIGAFTNNSPYILSGIPFVPNIYALEAPDFGTTGSGISVLIKAKANN